MDSCFKFIVGKTREPWLDKEIKGRIFSGLKTILDQSICRLPWDIMIRETDALIIKDPREIKKYYKGLVREN